MPINIRPRRVVGPWTDGYVLDVHSTGSTFLGYDQYGHPQFETHRSEAGELLYRFKYRGDATALAEIGEVSEQFIRGWGIGFEVVVPVLPSRQRTVQPVFQIADEIGRRFGVPVHRDAVRRLRDTGELKNVHDFDERQAALTGAFGGVGEQVAGRRVLLVDDLIRSGATIGAIASALLAAEASAVNVFALTKTRTG